MKIGIITLHFADNYGAALQAYGTQAMLRQLGHEPVFIDYRPRYMTHGGVFRFPRSKRDLHGLASNLQMRLSRVRQSIHGGKQAERFAEFRWQYFPVTRPYFSCRDLQENPPEVDVLLCGSDQIWNPPSRYGVDPAYFADFGSMPRISFASSFGRSDVAADYAEQMKPLLKKIRHLSVRERSGVDLIARLTGQSAYWAPDPTVMVDDYRPITPSVEGGSCFVYTMRSGGGVQNAMDAVRSARDLRMVSPYNPLQRWKLPAETVWMGPAEWLGHVAASSFVVTNSYHATMFSLIFNRPFICLWLPGGNRALSDRLASVLSRVGLERHLVEPGDLACMRDLAVEEVDWVPVNERLAEWRTEAYGYLASSIRGISCQESTRCA